MQIDRKVVEQLVEAWEQINKYGFVLADYEGPMEQAITALKAALEQPEPLGPGESWEYDDGLTMNRRVYRHGKLTEVITIEIIQDTPQMRPFRVAHSFGNREHRPTGMEDLRKALAQPEDKSQAAFEHWVETVEATQEQPIIQPEIKADNETRWLPMPWKGLTEEEHNYYKALGFVGVKAVEEKLRAKNSTLVSK
jgi:hypothetical protein